MASELRRRPNRILSGGTGFYLVSPVKSVVDKLGATLRFGTLSRPSRGAPLFLMGACGSSSKEHNEKPHASCRATSIGSHTRSNGSNGEDRGDKVLSSNRNTSGGYRMKYHKSPRCTSPPNNCRRAGLHMNQEQHRDRTAGSECCTMHQHQLFRACVNCL